MLCGKNNKHCSTYEEQIVDSDKKNYEISKSYSHAFEQFKKFEEIYGGSSCKLSEEILAQKKLIRASLVPFYLSYQNIYSSLQPEIDKLREPHLSGPTIYLLNNANFGLSALFAEQQILTKLLEDTTAINHFWQEKIESFKNLSSEISAAKLALQSHFNDISLASLLAQERLLHTPWANFEKNVFCNIKEFSLAIESFNEFIGSYGSLFQSFKKPGREFVNFPPFVSSLPPIEILTGADLLDTLSRDESKTECSVEEADNLELKIRKDIETSLEKLLELVNPEIKSLWQGAKQSLISDNPDKPRHIIVSLRDMLTHVLHTIAPDSEVCKWTSNPSHFHENRPTREARLLFICRYINHSPFEQFVKRDVDAHLKFIQLFQTGTHGLNINFTERQLKTLLIRTESLVRFLLVVWKKRGKMESKNGKWGQIFIYDK